MRKASCVRSIAFGAASILLLFAFPRAFGQAPQKFPAQRTLQKTPVKPASEQPASGGNAQGMQRAVPAGNMVPSIRIGEPADNATLFRLQRVRFGWTYSPGRASGAAKVQRTPSMQSPAGPPVNVSVQNAAGTVLTLAQNDSRLDVEWLVPRDFPEGTCTVVVETADRSLSDRKTFRVANGPDSDGDGVPDFLEDELAKTFAPEVRLHPNDPMKPANVDWYLARVKMGFHHELDADCVPLKAGQVNQGNVARVSHRQKNLVRQHKGHKVYSGFIDGKKWAWNTIFYLAQKDDETRKGCSSPSAWIVYAHVVPSRKVNPGGFSIQYWYFFPYDNRFASLNLNHESDWEHITVTVDEQRTVKSIFYSQHEGGKRYSNPPPQGGDVTFVNATHPVVYIAKGSHASYPKARDDWPITGYEMFKDSTADGGPAWKTWNSCVNVGEVERPMNGQEFIRYGGLWGRKGSGVTKGKTDGKHGPGLGRGPMWADDGHER